MLLAKLKLAVGAVMVIMALGASGLVYRAAGQSNPAGKGGNGRPATELDVLKQEIELLKLKLEVVEQKVRAQEDELRALRANAKGNEKNEAARVAEAIQEAVRQLDATHLKALRDSERKTLELRKLTGLNAEQGALSQQLTTKYRELLSGQTKSDPLQEAEDALKALREARDPETQRKAADTLGKILKTLREQQQKEKPDMPPR